MARETSPPAIRPLAEQDPRADPRWDLVERIAASHGFRSSTRLKDFLLYITDCALREAPEEATEQQIGMHVFQRPAGYNSSEDSIVRTHARLLRQKLAEYFTEEGASEELLLEVPKGHYLPAFHPRLETVTQPPSPVQPHVVLEVFKEHPKALPVRPKPGWKLAAGIVILLLLAALGGWWGWSRMTDGRSSVERLWAPFFADNSSLLIYSNARFTGDSRSGLRYALPQPSPGQDRDLVDTYTGIGEVAAVYDLTRLFDKHHSSFTLKRSLLVTWDEAKLRNLIFIGSVAENPSLRDVTSTTDFTLMNGDGFAGIVNHHPRPGEPALYSRPEHPLNKDYAILALLPGVQPGRRMLIFSGLMTMGTQAAVEFACHRETLDELLRQATNSKGEVRPFEAVLETTIGGGVPLQTRLVTIHVH
jgi:hypothetical protein